MKRLLRKVLPDVEIDVWWRCWGAGLAFGIDGGLLVILVVGPVRLEVAW